MKRKHYLIVGMGLSGQSVAKLALKLNCTVSAMDRNATALKESGKLEHLLSQGLILHDETVTDFEPTPDCVILSPGIPKTHPAVIYAEQRGIETIGEIEFAMRYLHGVTFVGVTGTNGKTTVTEQITHTLNYYAIPALSMGNNGVPLSELAMRYLEEGHIQEVIVLELSSYQLETLESKVFTCGIFLNLTPDHLDRYSSILDYGRAKMRLGQCLNGKTPLLVHRDIIDAFPELIKGSDLNISQFESPASDLSWHDAQNLEAVFQICLHWNLTRQQVQEAAKCFTKPPHRIEFVDTIKGIHFVDDSKGTNVDAVLKAVNTIQGPIILIAGGVAKGAVFHCWEKPFKDKVKTIYAIGDSASQLQKELGNSFSVYLISSMEEAVNAAFIHAVPGDTILLSPGCASTDMFKDYRHRGEVFQKCVRQLATESTYTNIHSNLKEVLL